MILKKITSLGLILSLFSTSLFSEDHQKPSPKHGGFVFEVGHDIAFMEVVHDASKGLVLMYFYDADNHQEVKSLDKPPRLNLDTEDGRQQVKSSLLKSPQNKQSQFFAQSDLLKGKVKGEIPVKLDGIHYLIKF